MGTVVVGQAEGVVLGRPCRAAVPDLTWGTKYFRQVGTTDLADNFARDLERCLANFECEGRGQVVCQDKNRC